MGGEHKLEVATKIIHSTSPLSMSVCRYRNPLSSAQAAKAQTACCDWCDVTLH